MLIVFVTGDSLLTYKHYRTSPIYFIFILIQMSRIYGYALFFDLTLTVVRYYSDFLIY